MVSKYYPVFVPGGGHGIHQGCEHARDASTTWATRFDTIADKTEILTLTQPRSDPSTELG